VPISSPITLLDTFVIASKIGEEGSIYRGKYKDRYYPGLLENLDKEERKQVLYYSTLSGFKNVIKAFRLIRNANDQFIIPDDFLKILDYLFILLYPCRILKIRIPNTLFLGFDVTSTLRNEQLLNCSNSSSFGGLLNYRFAFRTAQENVPIRLLIDWHENQVIDRGMIVGFRRFHPKTNITGYQGYIISKTLHIYIFPTPSEFRSQAIPHRIGVIGRGLLKDIQEFSDDFEAIVAPAFRFSKVWKGRKKNPEPGVFTILVALPISLEGSANILKLIVSVLDKFDKSDFRFWVKPHPTHGPEQIKPLLDGMWPENFHFKTGDFNECAEGANLLIGNASSTCLEVMAKGVPVIVVGDRNGIIENPIPETITEDIWQLCYNPEEIAEAVRFYKNRSPEKIKEYEKVGRRIREEYFEPVTREGIRRFLEL
jgi:glycosyltransferase involved in cell wall biosynthesis